MFLLSPAENLLPSFQSSHLKSLGCKLSLGECCKEQQVWAGWGAAAGLQEPYQHHEGHNWEMSRAEQLPHSPLAALNSG